MKEKYVELAKKILDEKINKIERVDLEDQLIEMAYQIAAGYDLKPEDFDTLMSDKRAKVGLLKPVGDLRAWMKNKLEEESKEFLAAKEKTKILEELGDVLEIVETYTARF